MKPQKEVLIFDIESLDILTAIDNDVYVRGYFDNRQCVHILSRNLLMSSLTDWLDRKRTYWEATHNFCGVGYFLSYDYIEGDSISVKSIDNNEMEWVRSFRIFDLEIDMEHG